MKIFWLAPITVAIALGWLCWTTDTELFNLDISINFVSANEYDF
ncbi:MAG: hypothetical protein WC415_00055 [Patescibacteria group bacterium]|jgi:hypothetical protein